MTLSLKAFAADDVIIDESERTIESLNNLMSKMGLPVYKSDPKLKEMSSYHSKYMRYNDAFSSVEDSTKEYFRGRYPWDRASYFDYEDKYVYEFIKRDINNLQSGIDRIINDPITRSIILNPMYTSIGMAMDEGYATFVVGGNKINYSKLITYPYNGQLDVSSKNNSAKYSSYSKKKNENIAEKVGLPITISYYSPSSAKFSNIKASVVNVNTGEEIPISVLTSKDYYLLDNSILLLPLTEYDYSTRYQVKAEFEVIEKDGVTKPYKKEFVFKTDNSKTDDDVKKYMTRGKFTELLVKNEGYKLVEPLEFRFSDVELSTPLSKYIYTATSKKLINGFPNGKFEPESNITREQAYTIIVKAFEASNSDIIVTDEDNLVDYSDKEDISNWAITYVKKAKELGIIIETNGKIMPKDYLTEKQFNMIIDNYMKNIKL